MGIYSNDDDGATISVCNGRYDFTANMIPHSIRITVHTYIHNCTVEGANPSDDTLNDVIVLGCQSTTD